MIFDKAPLCGALFALGKIEMTAGAKGSLFE